MANDTISAVCAFANMVSLRLEKESERIMASDSFEKREAALQALIPDSDLHLHRWQVTGVLWLDLLASIGMSGILADEMGLGKTIQALMFSVHRNTTSSTPLPSLVIQPPSVTENWRREALRWTQSPILTLPSAPAARTAALRWLLSMGADGTKARRAKYCAHATRFDALVRGEAEEAPIVIVPYSLLGDKKVKAAMQTVAWGTVIIDEAQRLKNRAAMTYKTVQAIPAKQRVLLTGTPIQNSPDEVLALIGLISPDVNTILTDANADIATKTSSMPAEAVEPFILRREKIQVIDDLPEMTRVTLKVKLSESHRAVYDDVIRRVDLGNVAGAVVRLRLAAAHPLLCSTVYQAERRALCERVIQAQSEEKEDEDEALTGEALLDAIDCALGCPVSELNPASGDTPATFLDPFTHSNTRADSPFKGRLFDWTLPAALTLAGIDHTPPDLAAAKLDAVAGIIAKHRAKGERVAVFTQFRSVLDLLELRLGAAPHPPHPSRVLRLDGQTPTPVRQTLIDEFSDPAGTADVMLLSTRAGGVGINLTAANVAIFHDHDYNPTSDEQAEARVHRIGQTRPVTVYRVVAEDTVDEAVLEIARRKADANRAVLDGVTDSAEAELGDYIRKARGA